MGVKIVIKSNKNDVIVEFEKICKIYGVKFVIK